MKIGTIKIRPAILLIVFGLIFALGVISWAVLETVRGNLSVELLAAVVAFGGTIVTGLTAVAGKLVESEEKGK